MPKTSSIRSAVLVEHRLVTDGQTDRHRPMARRADAQHRAEKNQGGHHKVEEKNR